jgi:hypothetical protein
MKKMIFLAAAAMCLSLSATSESPAQQRYTYTVSRTHTIPIDWRPERQTHQRYTISVSPLHLASHGVKFDFERELPRPGHWLGTSVALYLAPPRGNRWGYWETDDNNRAWFNSGFDSYHRMWGVGTSAIFKNTFSHRGWYFSTGLTFDFFRVGVKTGAYVPYKEDGLTFYEYGTTIDTKSYFKPTARIVIGKHVALSERCYFDFHAGVGLSYALYKRDRRHDLNSGYNYDWYYPRFSDIGGFAYRGLAPVGGFRFGVLLWKDLR